MFFNKNSENLMGETFDKDASAYNVNLKDIEMVKLVASSMTKDEFERLLSLDDRIPKEYIPTVAPELERLFGITFKEPSSLEKLAKFAGFVGAAIAGLIVSKRTIDFISRRV